MATTHDEHAIADELRRLADLIEAGPATARGALQLHYPDGDRAGVDYLVQELNMEPADECDYGNSFGYQSSGRYGQPVSVIVACKLHRSSDEERRARLTAELAELDRRIAARNGATEVPA